MTGVRDLGGRASCPGLAVMLLLASPAGAQGSGEEEIRVVATRATVSASATAGCEGGLVNDDGVLEGSVSFHGGGSPDDWDAAMRFTGPGAGHRVEQVCVCWRRDPGAAGTLEHEIRFYRANGPGGGPGSLLAALDAEASGIGTSPTMITYDVAAADVMTPGSDFYVGVRWNSGSSELDLEHTLCFDQGDPPIHRMFVKPVGSGSWFDFVEIFPPIPPPFKPLRALGIRTKLQAGVGGPASCGIGACVEDDTTICLDGGRFEVRVGFDPPNDADTQLEPARAERLTADTGYFTFFDPNNVEAVIKVLDACPVNDRHWVFAGGLTDVMVQIRVCDRATGVQKLYTNPQGTPFQPIQDTSAFATCP